MFATILIIWGAFGKTDLLADNLIRTKPISQSSNLDFPDRPTQVTLQPIADWEIDP